MAGFALPLLVGGATAAMGYYGKVQYENIKDILEEIKELDDKRKARVLGKQERGHTTPARKKVRRDIREQRKRDREFEQLDRLASRYARKKRAKQERGHTTPAQKVRKKAKGGLVTNFKGTF